MGHTFEGFLIVLKRVLKSDDPDSALDHPVIDDRSAAFAS